MKIDGAQRRNKQIHNYSGSFFLIESDKELDKKIHQQRYRNSEQHNKLDLIDLYSTIQTTIAECTFLLSGHGTFLKIDLVLSHRLSLNKFQMIDSSDLNLKSPITTVKLSKEGIR